MSVAPEVIFVMTLVTGLVVVGVVYAVMKTRRAEQPVIGASNITKPLVPIGTRGEVRSPLQPTGSIYAAGEEWSARRDDGGLLQRGTVVRVIGNDGMVLIVEQMSPTTDTTEGTA